LPVKLIEEHEGHFRRVNDNFPEYFKEHDFLKRRHEYSRMDVPNMLAIYYTTNGVLENALKKK
jgi:hypothetical protein